MYIMEVVILLNKIKEIEDLSDIELHKVKTQLALVKSKFKELYTNPNPKPVIKDLSFVELIKELSLKVESGYDSEILLSDITRLEELETKVFKNKPFCTYPKLKKGYSFSRITPADLKNRYLDNDHEYIKNDESDFKLINKEFAFTEKGNKLIVYNFKIENDESGLLCEDGFIYKFDEDKKEIYKLVVISKNQERLVNWKIKEL